MPRQSAAQRAGRKAEKIHEEIYGKKEGEETADEILASLDGEPPKGGEETPPEPAATKNDGEETPPEPKVAEPAPAPEPAHEPERDQREVVQQLEERLEKTDHKYKVLQGIHRKLLEENMELRSQLDEANSRNANPVPANPVAQPKTDVSLISAEEREDYGSEMIDVMKRAAREAVADEMADLKAENARLHGELAGVSNQINTSAKSNIYATLDSEVPNWRDINEDESFLIWLAEPDLFSGKQRQDLLKQAFDANDTARVVRFFRAYLSEDAAVAPAPATEPAPAAPVAPKVDVKSMVAPGKPKQGGAPSDQADTRVFTQQEIKDFYKSVQLGKFPGTEADKRRMEAAIIRAANEGRVHHV